MKRIAVAALAASAGLTLTAPAVARPASLPPAASDAREEEPEPVEINAAPPPGVRLPAREENGDAAGADAAAPAPAAPSAPDPVVTAATAEPAAAAPVNPYANSYNELLPLEPEAEEERSATAFGDWGLLGLLGLLGLFGLKRRDRLVYSERIDPAER